MLKSKNEINACADTFNSVLSTMSHKHRQKWYSCFVQCQFRNNLLPASMYEASVGRYFATSFFHAMPFTPLCIDEVQYNEWLSTFLTKKRLPKSIQRKTWCLRINFIFQLIKWVNFRRCSLIKHVIFSLSMRTPFRIKSHAPQALFKFSKTIYLSSYHIAFAIISRPTKPFI